MDEEHEVERREQPQEPAAVEVPDPDLGPLGLLAEQEGGDEEAAEHEEQVHPDEPAPDELVGRVVPGDADLGEPGMEEDDEQHRDCPETVERR